MAFSFESLKEMATDLAQTSVNKSKQVAEITKLKMANMGEEDNIKKAYVEIGKLYYAERGATPEGGYAAACGKISAAKATIEANNLRISALRSDDDDNEVAEAAETVTEAAEEAVEAVAEAAEEAVEAIKDEIKPE